MTYKLSFVTDLPDPAAFETMMRDYYRIMLDKLSAVGGPKLSADDLAASTMAHLGTQKVLIATDKADTVMGCGMLHNIRPDAAEFKRMYVRPEAQGAGLGRKLFEMRIAEAKRMGCKTIYADTVKGNTPMLNMYESFGFSYIPRYPENANPPEMAPYLVFLKYDVPA